MRPNTPLSGAELDEAIQIFSENPNQCTNFYNALSEVGVYHASSAQKRVEALAQMAGVRGSLVLVKSGSSGGGGSTAPDVGEKVEYKGYKPNTKEMIFSVKHPIVASNVGTVSKGSNNISTVSHRFATTGIESEGGLQSKIYGDNTEGTQVNAFRHTMWQATIY